MYEQPDRFGSIDCTTLLLASRCLQIATYSRRYKCSWRQKLNSELKMVKKELTSSNRNRPVTPIAKNNTNRKTHLLLICSACFTVVRVGINVLGGRSLQQLDHPFVQWDDLPTLRSSTETTENSTTSATTESSLLLGLTNQGESSHAENNRSKEQQHQYQQHQDYYNADETTWALVTPPGLMGGYRNQVFRLFGMMVKAKRQNIRQVLYPSILWNTFNDQSQPLPVPMEDLFDIDHWNHHPAVREQQVLPKLVAHVGEAGGDCWPSRKNETMLDSDHERYHNHTDGPLLQRVLQRPRFLTPIANISWGYVTGEIAINPRRFDISPHIQHCKHPVAYGAGGGRGILWTTYMEFSRARPRDKATGYVEPHALEEYFLQALKPLPRWRRLSQQCVQERTKLSTTATDTSGDIQQPAYIALHPRVEVEMMAHTCGQFMNKNLTSIFEYVQEFLNHNTDTLGNVTGVFVAMSRAGAAVTDGNPYRRFRRFIDENMQTMNRVMGKDTLSGEGLSINGGISGTRQIPVFECGDQLVQRYYESQTAGGHQVVNYGSLLPSIINFDVAVEATAFVGVRGSSWSNSVWTTRYYLGKGNTNYEYTRGHGIREIENNGLPQPHENCDGMADPGR